MKRSLLSLLLLAGALAACGDKPPGQLEPIPRPPGYQDPPKAEAPKPAAPPAPDPNKVVLRWKLAAGAPMAFRLEGSPEAGASALKAVYVLQRPEAGDNVLRIAQESSKEATERATFSERGFILDGLGDVDRNLATLLLELPKDPVGVGDTWALGADFVNPEPLGLGFATKKSDRRNTVKLESLTPEGDDRVATIQYDLFETVSGAFPPGALPAAATETSPLKAAPDKGKGKGKKPAAADDPHDNKPKATEVLSEVSFKGSGQFLVKAGRWRSWQGTLTSKTEGYSPAPGKSLAHVPPGTLKLQLTALDSVPAELQQPEAKK